MKLGINRGRVRLLYADCQRELCHRIFLYFRPFNLDAGTRSCIQRGSLQIDDDETFKVFCCVVVVQNAKSRK